MKSFGSDNHSGIHPEILQEIINYNQNHAIAYGDDEITQHVNKQFKELFGNKTESFFVFNGTAANVVCLQALTKPYNAIICAETAHIQVDECGAPEKFTGCKLLTIPATNGKITPEGVKKHLHGFGFQHHAQPKVISISQPTELGTVYQPSEIKELANLAHQYDMYLHVDGSRFSNAMAALNCDFKTISVDAGVDALSFGGTKNGMMIGEAVLLFNPQLAENFCYIRKQSAQLCSKMRFIAAQFKAYLTDELNVKLAKQANAMTSLLANKVSIIPNIQITQKVETNAVFAILPIEIIKEMQEHYFFYIWDEEKNEVRWMCSFDTTETDIENFVTLLANCVNKNM